MPSWNELSAWSGRSSHRTGISSKAGAILTLELFNDLPGFGPLLSDVARTADENAKRCHEACSRLPLSGGLTSNPPAGQSDPLVHSKWQRSARACGKMRLSKPRPTSSLGVSTILHPFSKGRARMRRAWSRPAASSALSVRGVVTLLAQMPKKIPEMVAAPRRGGVVTRLAGGVRRVAGNGFCRGAPSIPRGGRVRPPHLLASAICSRPRWLPF